MDLTHEYTHDIKHRFKYLTWIMSVTLLIIVARLYYLQIIKGSYYYFFSEQNSIKEMKIPSLRGRIYDRDGRILVDNRPAFDLVVIPQYIRDQNKVIESLSTITGLGPEEISDTLQKAKGLPAYYPVTIKSDISDGEFASVRAYKSPWYDEEDPLDLRGVDTQMRYARLYPDATAYSHLLGYLREIDEKKLKSYKEKLSADYQIGDFIGIGGVEEMWDVLLRGSDGFDQRVVNAIGREVIWPDVKLIHEDPRDGASLKTTIVAKLQEAAKKELEGKSGAVVAIDPSDGGILALYSSPSIDLNLLSSSEGSKYWVNLANDEARPLYNRAVQGTYPPGSTFKIVTATSALAEGEIKPDSHLFCGGGMRYGGRFYQCWRDGGHGAVGVIQAIAASCDTFFYQIGLRLGVDKIAKYANLLGFGKLTGIDIPNEKTGLIPTSEWKERTRGQKWQAGENLSIAVGQGYDTVTPLQNALMIAIIANGGKKIEPHIASSVADASGNEIYRWQNIGYEQVISPDVVAIVKEGLKNVVESPEGTAFRLKSLKLKIAGKTGTAQVISKEKWKSGVAELKDHAWFVGYAPYDDPKIAVAVIVEHGGFGASAAAPVVGKVIEAYLK